MVKVLAGFYAADAGTLRVGNDVVNLPWSQSAAMQHGLVFLHQNLGLIPSLSVSENLRLGGASMGPESRPWYLSRQRELEADEALLSAHGIAIDPRIRVASLTPVDRTMVALARALRRLDQLPDGAATKGILCLDEPMAFLPKKERSALTVRLRALAKRGYSIAIVSHNIDELPELAETVTVFRDGATVAEMETRSVSTHDIIDAAIGSTHSVLDRTGGSRGSVGSEQLGAPALEVSDLSGTRLRSFSLAVAQGEIVGVTGLVGSGFEELPYLLCGTASAERGALVIKGRSYQFRDLTASKLHVRCKACALGSRFRWSGA
jgi:ribose transport system ATP-binding protein